MPKFGNRSLNNLNGAHPALQEIMYVAIKEFDFSVIDGGRGRAAQELAVRSGNSKVHFGDSAHNWNPWLALDVYPYPFDFGGKEAAHVKEQFRILQLDVIKPIAKRMGIQIRQGIDFNMDGNLTNDKWDDLPHVELHPWREYAKHARLYEDK